MIYGAGKREKEIEGLSPGKEKFRSTLQKKKIHSPLQKKNSWRMSQFFLHGEGPQNFFYFLRPQITPSEQKDRTPVAQPRTPLVY